MPAPKAICCDGVVAFGPEDTSTLHVYTSKHECVVFGKWLLAISQTVDMQHQIDTIQRESFDKECKIVVWKWNFHRKTSDAYGISKNVEVQKLEIESMNSGSTIKLLPWHEPQRNIL